MNCHHEHPSVWVCFIFVGKSRGITLPYRMVEPGDPSDTGLVHCPTNGQLVSYAMGLSLSLCACLCEIFYGWTGSMGRWVGIITWAVDVVYSYVCLLPRLPNFGSRDNSSWMGIRVEQINMPLSSTQLNYLFDLIVDPPAVYIVMLKFWGRWCNVCWSSPHFHWLNPMVNHLPSSKLTVCYWTWPFIVDLPIKNGGFL